MSNSSQSGWENVVKPRMKSRSQYGARPASGPNIYKTYQEIFNNNISNITSPSVLVLGSTPELRDLILEKNIQLTTIDLNHDIIDGMRQNMVHQNHPKETTVIGNWLNMPLKKESFDFIMGDGISNNIITKDHHKLFSEINRVLKKDSKVLLRDSALINNHPRQTVQQIIQQAHREKWHKYDLFFEIYVYSSDGGYDPKQQVVDMSLIEQKLINEIYPKKILTKKEEFYLRQFMSGQVKSTFIHEKQWLKNFRQHFNQVEIFKANDYKFCDYFKFFLGTK